MPLHDLAHYGLSAERGFLSPHEIDEIALPGDFGPIEEAAAKLSGLVTTGRVRHWLDALPTPDIAAFLATAADAEIGRAAFKLGQRLRSGDACSGHPPEKSQGQSCKIGASNGMRGGMEA